MSIAHGSADADFKFDSRNKCRALHRSTNFSLCLDTRAPETAAIQELEKWGKALSIKQESNAFGASQ